jgi:hypothetical protein
MSDAAEQPGAEHEPPERPQPDPEKLRAARERDEAAAEQDDAPPAEAPAEPELDDEAVLALLPPELRAAIDAGEVEREPVLEATREAIASGAFEPPAEAEQPADPLLEAKQAYFAAVAEVLGADAEVLPCEHCNGRGFNPAERLPSQHHRKCEECGGRGAVTSGSLVQSQAELPCEGCGGNGWTRVLVQAEAPAVPIVAPLPPAPPAPVAPFVPYQPPTTPPVLS